eukprot:829272-Prorocentrum_minimum.AAC.2
MVVAYGAGGPSRPLAGVTKHRHVIDLQQASSEAGPPSCPVRGLVQIWCRRWLLPPAKCRPPSRLFRCSSRRRKCASARSSAQPV